MNRGLRFMVVRPMSIVLALAYFFTNCLFAHALETNIWKNRQRSLTLSLPKLTTNQIINPPKVSAPSGFLSVLRPYGTFRNLPSSAKNAKVVIHIQDIHRNTEAQENIYCALRTLGDNQTNLIALEGAFGQFDLTSLRDFPAASRNKVAEYFLSEGWSGAILSALDSDKPLNVIGVDDRHAYDANVAALRSAQPDRSKIKTQLAEAERKLEADKTAVFNTELLAFDRVVEKYRDGQSPLGVYATAVHNSNRQFPQTGRFVKALQFERGLDIARVEAERARLVAHLSEKMDAVQLRGLIADAEQLRNGQKTYAEFYGRLERDCKTAGIDLARYSAVRDYIRYVLLSDGLDGEKLFKELAAQEKARYDALTKTENEKGLVKEARMLHLQKKLVGFELTKEEWAEYKKGVLSNQFSVLSEKPLLRTNELRTENFEDFYQQAELRDQKMAENLISSFPHASGGNPGKAGSAAAEDAVAVLVTGGFHSSGIDKQLVAAGYTVVPFTPKLTKVDSDNGSAYLDFFMREKTPLEKLLQRERLFLNPEILTAADQVAWTAVNTAAADIAKRSGPRGTTVEVRPDGKSGSVSWRGRRLAFGIKSLAQRPWFRVTWAKPRAGVKERFSLIFLAFSVVMAVSSNAFGAMSGVVREGFSAESVSGSDIGALSTPVPQDGASLAMLGIAMVGLWFMRSAKDNESGALPPVGIPIPELETWCVRTLLPQQHRWLTSGTFTKTDLQNFIDTEIKLRISSYDDSWLKKADGGYKNTDLLFRMIDDVNEFVLIPNGFYVLTTKDKHYAAGRVTPAGTVMTPGGRRVAHYKFKATQNPIWGEVKSFLSQIPIGVGRYTPRYIISNLEIDDKDANFLKIKRGSKKIDSLPNIEHPSVRAFSELMVHVIENFYDSSGELPIKKAEQALLEAMSDQVSFTLAASPNKLVELPFQRDTLPMLVKPSIKSMVDGLVNNQVAGTRLFKLIPTVRSMRSSPVPLWQLVQVLKTCFDAANTPLEPVAQVLLGQMSGHLFGVINKDPTFWYQQLLAETKKRGFDKKIKEMAVFVGDANFTDLQPVLNSIPTMSAADAEKWYGDVYYPKLRELKTRLNNNSLTADDVRAFVAEVLEPHCPAIWNSLPSDQAVWPTANMLLILNGEVEEKIMLSNGVNIVTVNAEFKASSRVLSKKIERTPSGRYIPAYEPSKNQTPLTDKLLGAGHSPQLRNYAFDSANYLVLAEESDEAIEVRRAASKSASSSAVLSRRTQFLHALIRADLDGALTRRADMHRLAFSSDLKKEMAIASQDSPASLFLDLHGIGHFIKPGVVLGNLMTSHAGEMQRYVNTIADLGAIAQSPFPVEGIFQYIKTINIQEGDALKLNPFQTVVMREFGNELGNLGGDINAWDDFLMRESADIPALNAKLKTTANRVYRKFFYFPGESRPAASAPKSTDPGIGWGPVKDELRAELEPFLTKLKLADRIEFSEGADDADFKTKLMVRGPITVLEITLTPSMIRATAAIGIQAAIFRFTDELNEEKQKLLLKPLQKAMETLFKSGMTDFAPLAAVCEALPAFDRDAWKAMVKGAQESVTGNLDPDWYLYNTVVDYMDRNWFVSKGLVLDFKAEVESRGRSLSLSRIKKTIGVLRFGKDELPIYDLTGLTRQANRQHRTGFFGFGHSDYSDSVSKLESALLESLNVPTPIAGNISSVNYSLKPLLLKINALARRASPDAAQLKTQISSMIEINRFIADTRYEREIGEPVAAHHSNEYAFQRYGRAFRPSGQMQFFIDETTKSPEEAYTYAWNLSYWWMAGFSPKYAPLVLLTMFCAANDPNNKTQQVQILGLKRLGQYFQECEINKSLDKDEIAELVDRLADRTPEELSQAMREIFKEDYTVAPEPFVVVVDGKYTLSDDPAYLKQLEEAEPRIEQLPNGVTVNWGENAGKHLLPAATRKTLRPYIARLPFAQTYIFQRGTGTKGVADFKRKDELHLSIPPAILDACQQAADKDPATAANPVIEEIGRLTGRINAEIYQQHLLSPLLNAIKEIYDGNFESLTPLEQFGNHLHQEERQRWSVFVGGLGTLLMNRQDRDVTYQHLVHQINFDWLRPRQLLLAALHRYPLPDDWQKNPQQALFLAQIRREAGDLDIDGRHIPIFDLNMFRSTLSGEKPAQLSGHHLAGFGYFDDEVIKERSKSELSIPAPPGSSLHEKISFLVRKLMINEAGRVGRPVVGYSSEVVVLSQISEALTQAAMERKLSKNYSENSTDYETDFSQMILPGGVVGTASDPGTLNTLRIALRFLRVGENSITPHLALAAFADLIRAGIRMGTSRTGMHAVGIFGIRLMGHYLGIAPIHAGKTLMDQFVWEDIVALAEKISQRSLEDLNKAVQDIVEKELDISREPRVVVVKGRYMLSNSEEYQRAIAEPADDGGTGGGGAPIDSDDEEEETEDLDDIAFEIPEAEEPFPLADQNKLASELASIKELLSMDDGGNELIQTLRRTNGFYPLIAVYWGVSLRAIETWIQEEGNKDTAVFAAELRDPAQQSGTTAEDLFATNLGKVIDLAGGDINRIAAYWMMPVDYVTAFFADANNEFLELHRQEAEQLAATRRHGALNRNLARLEAEYPTPELQMAFIDLCEGRVAVMAETAGVLRSSVDVWLRTIGLEKAAEIRRLTSPGNDRLEKLVEQFHGNLTALAEFMEVPIAIVQVWFAGSVFLDSYAAELRLEWEKNVPERDTLMALIVQFRGNLTRIAAHLFVSLETLKDWLRHRTLADVATSTRNEYPGRPRVEELITRHQGRVEKMADAAGVTEATVRDWVSKAELREKLKQVRTGEPDKETLKLWIYQGGGKIDDIAQAHGVKRAKLREWIVKHDLVKYVHECRMNALASEERFIRALAYLGDDKDRLMEYIMVFFPKLSPVECAELISLGLRSIRDTADDSAYLNHPQKLKKIEIHAHREGQAVPTPDDRIKIRGRAPRGAQYVMVSGGYHKKIPVGDDGEFVCVLPLRYRGQENHFLFTAVDESKPATPSRSPSYKLTVRQTGVPFTRREALFKLMMDANIGKLRDDANFHDTFIEQIQERSLLGDFYQNVDRGFTRLDARIAAAKTQEEAAILKRIRREFYLVHAMNHRDLVPLWISITSAHGNADDVTMFQGIARELEHLPEIPAMIEGRAPGFHQVWILRKMLQIEERTKKGGVLAAEQGTGKTLVGLLYGHIRAREGKNVLISCPNPVVQGWLTEAREMLARPQLAAYEGDYRTRDALLEAEEHLKGRVRVSNIEYLAQRQTPDRLRGLKPDYLLADEGHILTNPDSEQSKGLFALGADSINWALSGTPASTSGDIPPLLHFIKNLSRESAGRGRRQLKTRDMDQMVAEFLLLRSSTVRIKMDDVRDDLDVKHKTVDWSYTEDQMTSLLHALVGITASLQAWFRQLVEIFRINNRPDGANPKMDAFVQEFEDILKENPKAKVVVFARHRDDIEAVQDRLQAYGARLYYGGDRVRAHQDRLGYRTKEQERNGRKKQVRMYFRFNGTGLPIETIKAEGHPLNALEYERLQFLKDPACRVIVVSESMGTYGVNMPATDVMLFDTPKSNRAASQQIARALRLNTPNKEVKVHWFIGRYDPALSGKFLDLVRQIFFGSTFDERMKEMLDRQKLVASLLLDMDPGAGGQHHWRDLLSTFLPLASGDGTQVKPVAQAAAVGKGAAKVTVASDDPAVMAGLVQAVNTGALPDEPITRSIESMRNRVFKQLGGFCLSLMRDDVITDPRLNIPKKGFRHMRGDFALPAAEGASSQIVDFQYDETASDVKSLVDAMIASIDTPPSGRGNFPKFEAEAGETRIRVVTAKPYMGKERTGLQKHFGTKVDSGNRPRSETLTLEALVAEADPANGNLSKYILRAAIALDKVARDKTLTAAAKNELMLSWERFFYQLSTWRSADGRALSRDEKEKILSSVLTELINQRKIEDAALSQHGLPLTQAPQNQFSYSDANTEAAAVVRTRDYVVGDFPSWMHVAFTELYKRAHAGTEQPDFSKVVWPWALEFADSIGTNVNGLAEILAPLHDKLVQFEKGNRRIQAGKAVERAVENGGAPLAMAGWAAKQLDLDDPQAPAKAAFIEEAVYGFILQVAVPYVARFLLESSWYISTFGHADSWVMPALQFTLFIISAIHFGFAHKDLLVVNPKTGRLIRLGDATFPHKLGFVLLGAIFRIGFVFAIWNPALALPAYELGHMMHTLYNTELVPRSNGKLAAGFIAAKGSAEQLNETLDGVEQIFGVEGIAGPFQGRSYAQINLELQGRAARKAKSDGTSKRETKPNVMRGQVFVLNDATLSEFDDYVGGLRASAESNRRRSIIIADSRETYEHAVAMTRGLPNIVLRTADEDGVLTTEGKDNTLRLAAVQSLSRKTWGQNFADNAELQLTSGGFALDPSGLDEASRWRSALFILFGAWGKAVLPFGSIGQIDKFARQIANQA